MAFKLLPCLLAGVTIASAIPSPLSAWTKTTTINTAAINATSAVEFTYPGCGLDGLKVHPPNATNLDSWYFDAVSTDLAKGDLSSVVVTFLVASADAFPTGGERPGTLLVFIAGTFKDGTPFGPSAVLPDQATINAKEIGSDGSWGSGTGWTGSSNGKDWTVSFSNSDDNLSGSMTLTTTAPAHLPCGPAKAGGTEVLSPHFGWSNAVSDSTAHVKFNVNGTSLAFIGSGYHDKNWSDGPLFDHLATWYWGHGRVGPYSIVWFDTRDQAGKEYTSAYVSRDGKIITASCTSAHSVVVRPWGGDDTYPPPPTDSTPNGFILSFADVGGKQMQVNVTNSVKILSTPGILDRWIGTVEGGFVGEHQKWTGVASYEQFKV